jgi:hypothetical protein
VAFRGQTARVPKRQAADDSKSGAGGNGTWVADVFGPRPNRADQFTETGWQPAYHPYRRIVNKVTFYLTFC